MENRTQKRAEAAALKAVGKPFQVRLDSRTTVNGTITACQYLGAVPKGTRETQQYEITMSCGTIGVERKFTVSKLP